ncbi:15806_t:CDS:2, partial [Funneliformis geosporum]
TKSSKNSETEYQSSSNISSEDDSSSVASDNVSSVKQKVSEENLNRLLAQIVALENKNKELEFQAKNYQSMQSNTTNIKGSTLEKRAMKKKETYRKHKSCKKLQESSLEESSSVCESDEGKNKNTRNDRQSANMPIPKPLSGKK